MDAEKRALQRQRLRHGLLHTVNTQCPSIEHVQEESTQDMIGCITAKDKQGARVLFVCTEQEKEQVRRVEGLAQEKQAQHVYWYIQTMPAVSKRQWVTSNKVRIEQRIASLLVECPSFQERTKRWKIRQTLLQMLQDRQAVLLPVPSNQVTHEVFMTDLDPERVQTYMTLYAMNPVTSEAIVSIYHGNTIKLPIIRALIEKRDKGVKLILVADNIVSQVRTFLDAEKRARRLADFWLFDSELLVTNPRYHVWQPQSIRILSDKEKQKLGTRRKFAHLQKMQQSDILAQYYGVQNGQVLEVKDNQPGHGETMYYVLVIGNRHEKHSALDKKPLAPSAGNEQKPIVTNESKNDVDTALLGSLQGQLFPHDQPSAFGIPLEMGSVEAPPPQPNNNNNMSLQPMDHDHAKSDDMSRSFFFQTE